MNYFSNINVPKSPKQMYIPFWGSEKKVGQKRAIKECVYCQILGSTWNRGKPSAQAEAERLNRMRTDGKGLAIAKSMGVEKNRGREKSETPGDGWCLMKARR